MAAGTDIVRYVDDGFRFIAGLADDAVEAGSNIARGRSFGSVLSGIRGGLQNAARWVRQNPKRLIVPGVIGAIGGTIAAAAGVGDEENELIPAGTPDYSAAEIRRRLEMMGGGGYTPTFNSAATIQDYINRNPYRGITSPNYTKLAEEQAARDRATLAEFLERTGTYGRNQAQAIQAAYNELAGRTGTVGQYEMGADVDLARSLEALYGAPVAAAAAPLAGETTAGLAAPSGEAATAADVQSTGTRSMADFLASRGAGSLEARQLMAQSQREQGIGSAAALRDFIAMAEAQRQADLESRISQQLSQAQLAETEFATEEARRRQAYDESLRQALLQAQLTDQQARSQYEAQRAQQGAMAASMANQFWDQAEGETKKQLVALFGPLGRENFMRYARQNPEILAAYGYDVAGQ